jgi:hypothetical protein
MAKKQDSNNYESDDNDDVLADTLFGKVSQPTPPTDIPLSSNMYLELQQKKVKQKNKKQMNEK